MNNSNFFTNKPGNTLLDKLVGLSESKYSYERFLAVAGFFRSTGYFALRGKLANIQEIKILVGINVDKIFSRQSSVEFAFSNAEMAKALYTDDFIRDVREARYAPEVEQGILQMIDDVKSGRLELRICKNKNLHAKFYLCLPMAEDYGENCCGSVIMGSSNLTDSGLGTKKNVEQQYEMNVELKDYPNVNFCLDEFMKLWAEGVPLTADDILASAQKTHLAEVTPYEIYLKVLIEYFGEQIEDDYTIDVDLKDFKRLKYQRDAVVQGYQILKKHHGVLLADVVGLGKTVVAAMIAKRFIEENGPRHTNVLVIFPPALEQNWKETFEKFGIKSSAQFITNGSLDKILEGKDRYKEEDLFDLIIVDEAHGFRSDNTEKYNQLMKICQCPRANALRGGITDPQKYVILLSATPINNSPADLENLLYLFQDPHQGTLTNAPDLRKFFKEKNDQYKLLMESRKDKDFDSKALDAIYEDIRRNVINEVTVRRTRNNLKNDEEYRKDLESQGIKFPEIGTPQSCTYQMDEPTSKLFYSTLSILCDDDDDNPLHLNYARYRALEFLQEKDPKYARATGFARTLAGIYRVHMVKRLESSFYAFKISLATLLEITDNMIEMWNNGKIIIAPDINVKKLQETYSELDMVIEKVVEKATKKGLSQHDITFAPEQFDKNFINLLQHDHDVLALLNNKWKDITVDPKFDLFMQYLQGRFYEENPSRKLVIFSESVDTLDYLYEKLTKSGYTDVLEVTSSNRVTKEQTIRENFDANYAVQDDKYNILLTSEVLAEGINLHRANVIINYDTPWNATRLMQRIGRINRIGTKADKINNFMFYPSRQGDEQIGLYKNALIKLQGFHDAFGEDAQIFSEEEIVKQFEMFNPNVKDEVDDKLKFRRELLDIFAHNRELYNKVKNLPPKCRTLRQTGKYVGQSVAFLKSNYHNEFYRVQDNKVHSLNLIDALKIFKANVEEKGQDPKDNNLHFDHLQLAQKEYEKTLEKATDKNSINSANLTKTELEAHKLIDFASRAIATDDFYQLADDIKQCAVKFPRVLKEVRTTLLPYKKNGVTAKDFKAIETLFRNWKDEYQHTAKNTENIPHEPVTIVVSETFI